MQLILVAFVVTLVCFYINSLWRKRNLIIASWNIPGPINLPIIGANYLFMCPSEDIFGKITRMQMKYPKIMKFWFGNELMYSIHEPSHVEKILTHHKCMEKGQIYDNITDCIGSGLISAKGPLWRKHRKTLMPSFNQKILDSFVEIFAKQSKVLTDILEKHRGKTIETYPIIAKCTLDMICETSMGVQLNLQKEDVEYGVLLDKGLGLMFKKMVYFWNHYDFVWNLTGGMKFKKLTKTMFDFVEMMVKEKIELKKQRRNSNAQVEDAPKRLAMLDLIMENSDFAEVEIRDEIRVFLIAGTETSASSLSFLLAVLGMFPDIQERVYNEVVEIMGHDRLPECKDLKLMKYTERVIKESLRLFPNVPLFFRAISEDLDLGDLVLPKGSTALFATVFIHRNPKYWPDPLKFDPDRFLPEEMAKRHLGTYVPFSYGPRNCIGMRYAMMSLKTMLANVIRRLKIHCDYEKIEDIELKANILLKFRDGCKTRVELRNREKA